jgi:hypothetical protein
MRHPLAITYRGPALGALVLPSLFALSLGCSTELPPRAGSNPIVGGEGDGVLGPSEPGGSGTVGNGPIGNVPPEGQGTPGSNTPLNQLNCAGDYIPEGRIWRLSRSQLVTSLATSFGANVSTADLPADAIYQATGYNNDSAAAWVNVQLADRLFDATQAAAQRVVDSQLGSDHCVRSSPDATCAAEFARSFGEHAFRRPLTAEEVGRYASFLTSEAAKYGGAVAARMALQAIMQSPHFLYRTEIGSGSPGQVELTQYELASSISYLVTDAPPDAELLAAASAARLSDKAEVQRHTRRLLATSGAHAKLQDFFAQYLQLGALQQSGIEPELIAPLTASAMAFVDDVVFSSTGSMRELFTASHGFVDAVTAPLFGVEAPGSGLERVELSPSQRLGIFTHPALLSAKHGAIHRGRAIKEGLLCGMIPPPPPGAGDNLAATQGPDPDATEQQRWASFQQDWPACATCHSTFQPMGVAFDQFDHHGRYRTTNEAGRTVDPSATVLGTGLSVDATSSFADAFDLLQQISGSELGQRCFAKRYLSYAAGRELQNGQACSVLRDVSAAFMKSELDILELIVATAQHDSFYVRLNQE